MRGDKLPLPPISTYAFSCPGAPVQDPVVARPVFRRLGSPLIAVGGASALVAMGVAWKGGPLEFGAGEVDSEGLGSAAGPGFSFQNEHSEEAGSGLSERGFASVRDEKSGNLEDLPILGVLQSRAQLRADRQATPQARPENGAVRFKLVMVQDSPVPAASRCDRGCAVESEVGSPEAAFVGAGIEEPEVAGSETVLMDGQLELASTAEAMGAAGSAPAIKADLAGELLVDAQPSVLLEAPAVLAVQEAPVASVSVPEGQAAFSGAQVDAGPAQVTALEEGSQIRARSPGDAADERERLARHIARIGERYPPVSSAEVAVNPSETPPEAEAASSSQGIQRTARDGSEWSSAGLRIPDSSVSSAIIVDDELVAIRLDDLVSLLEDSFDRRFYVWMRSSAAASKFVTSETLAAAGIVTSYDPVRKQLVFAAVAE